MKINKILAAGIAATLAVTSLSAVAGAEVQTKTFDVYRTQASFWSHSVKINADVNKTIAQKLGQASTETLTIAGIDKYVNDVLNYQGFLAYLLHTGDEDKYNTYAKHPENYNYGWDLWVSGIKITATGYQHIGDTATVTKTFSLFGGEDGNQGQQNTFYWNETKCKAQQADGKLPAWWADHYWTLKVLADDVPTYHDGEFASRFFSEITSLEIDVQLNGVTLNEDEYNYWCWMGTDTGDQDSDNSRYIDIGDITISGTKVPTEPASYTYGAASETDNTNDLAKIIKEQTSEELATYPKGESGKQGGTVLVGSAALATDVGSKLKTNQKAGILRGTKTDATYLKSTKILVWDGTNAGALTEVNLSDGAGKVAFVGNKIANKSGYIYTFEDKTANTAQKFAIYSPTKLSDDAKTAVQNKFKTLTASTTAAQFAATVGYTLLDDDAGTIDIADEIDANKHESIVPAAETVTTTPVPVVLVDPNGNASYQLNSWGNEITVMDYDDSVSTGHLLAYAFANGGWFESRSQYGDFATNNTAITDDIFGAKGTKYAYRKDGEKYLSINNTNTSGLVGSPNPSTSKQNGWMPKTTNNATAKIKNKIEREDVKLLSSTADYKSSGQTFGDEKTADANISIDGNQTYNATFWEGTNPYGFAGLASQVADFFNKQDNGTITFTFAANAGNTAGKWSDGVPSTEVGLKGFSSEYLNDFALFFNYKNTTGTMLSALKLDPTAGTVTFDIADYLKDCGGLTKATLENIYYGLDNGIKYDANTNKYGLWVSKVELSYDDAGKAAVDATTDDDTAEDDAAVVVADDDDDDAEVEDDDVAEDDDIFEDDDVIEDDDDDDDDVDADVIEDDDDDDTDVNNDVDYVDAGADDDANPGTGVGLAVIPAIVAAAAVVVSKKRK